MNPYILQGQPAQELGGLMPVFQNYGQQQANQQAALAQQNQQVQQAGQTGQGGMNPMAMAAALRKDKPTQGQINAQDAQMGGLGTYNPLKQYEVSNAYGTDPYSQQSRMLASQEF